MEKVKININFNSTSNVSLTFYVENANDAEKFFKVLSDEKLNDRVISANKVELSDEEKARIKFVDSQIGGKKIRDFIKNNSASM